jgi:hypothetical protein
MGLKFRLLRADEIDCRVASCSEYGVQLLLYKDARCDQNILDETVGPMNWQRKHTRDNANCIVSIWDDGKKQWIEKEDTGKESFTEAEKGLASDSFKRACFNWGIGRELYTAPQMFVKAKDLQTLKKETYQGKEKWGCKDTFTVTDIGYEGKKLVYVKILNNKNNVPIIFGKNPNATAPAPKAVEKKEADITSSKISQEKVDALVSLAVKDGVPLSRIVTLYKVADIESMTEKQHKNCMDNWDKIVEMK